MRERKGKEKRKEGSEGWKKKGFQLTCPQIYIPRTAIANGLTGSILETPVY